MQKLISMHVREKDSRYLVKIMQETVDGQPQYSASYMVVGSTGTGLIRKTYDENLDDVLTYVKANGYVEIPYPY